MNNLHKTTKKILDLIKEYDSIRPSEIVPKINISIQAVYKHLSKLLDEDLIQKTGTTPQVFYSLKESKTKNIQVKNLDDFIIEQNYLYVSPVGKIIRGLAGFQMWCQKNNFDFQKEKKIFLRDFKIKEKIRKNNLISGKKYILSGKGELFLDNIFFSDLYLMPHFGKIKLGQLVYLGKTSQNKEMISEIVEMVKTDIIKIIKKYNIQYVCFIPPTIDRKIQFLDVFKKKIKLNLLEIKAQKISSTTKIPQKTLRKLADRIVNARATITINPNQKIKGNVLIIDDAAGSGATLNETARKIKKISLQKIKVIGYSPVGSLRGFDVISEV